MTTGNQAGQAMKQLLLIGIGPGDPRQVTYEAVEALRSATVFFVLDKGSDKDDLVRLRRAILERYRPEGGYRATAVNGVLTQRDGKLTGATPGRVLDARVRPPR